VELRKLNSTSKFYCIPGSGNNEFNNYDTL